MASQPKPPESPAPGLTMNNMPIKPPVTKIQLEGRGRSPKRTTAKIVTTKGVIIKMAVNSPTGTTFRLIKAKEVEMMIKRPRTICSVKYWVRSRPRPCIGSKMALVMTVCSM